MISLRRRSRPRSVPRALFSGGTTDRSEFSDDYRRLISSEMRIKPCYADSWLLGRTGALDLIEEYDIPGAHVAIGTASDGEVEYNLTPSEYVATDVTNTFVEYAISTVRTEFRTNGGRTDRQAVASVVSSLFADNSDDLAPSDSMLNDIDRVSDIVYRYSVGLGVFDILLSDPKLEDIYIDAPCDRNRVHVTLSGVGGGNSHMRCRTNLQVEKREVMNLVNVLCRESGLPFCESSPVLETDLHAYDARATVVGYPMSPNGDAVAIRKRSKTPWTLTRLIANGTISADDAGLLSFLVQNRATFLICGARGAGKSSLLSAMMFEFPLSQRILSIEDTLELPGDVMRRMGYKVQSILVDDRMEGDSRSRSSEALRVSLRLGESALVLGEVRGDEARILYESMRVGRAGSSIMGTIHGDSARTVYDRVVHDMGISPEAFMATEVLVTLGTFRDRRTGAQARKISEFVATTDHIGEFSDLYASSPDFSLPVMRRTLSVGSMTADEAREDIRARSLVHGYLAELGKKYGDDYLSPRWVSAGNDQVSRMSGKSADEILASFKMRFGEGGE